MIDAAPHPSTSCPRVGQGRVDLLVVDDDRDIRETLQELLEGEGYESRRRAMVTRGWPARASSTRA